MRFINVLLTYLLTYLLIRQTLSLGCHIHKLYLFNAIPDTNHNANPTNPNTRYRCEYGWALNSMFADYYLLSLICTSLSARRECTYRNNVLAASWRCWRSQADVCRSVVSSHRSPTPASAACTELLLLLLLLCLPCWWLARQRTGQVSSGCGGRRGQVVGQDWLSQCRREADEFAIRASASSSSSSSSSSSLSSSSGICSESHDTYRIIKPRQKEAHICHFFIS